MRQIGDILGKRRADRCLNYLHLQAIEAELRHDSDDRYVIWVIDEDKVADAEEHFRAFKAAPDAAVFDAPERQIAARPKDQGTSRARYINVRSEIFGRGNLARVPVTVTLIGLSVFLMFVSKMPGAASVLRWLYYSEYYGNEFPEIITGQVWRLVTPILLHGGALHLLFNMLWLYQLGGNIEMNEGSIYFLGITMAFAVVCNTAQYLVAGPAFLGMSGIVYALFGYIWMMSRYQAGSRYGIAQQTVTIMLVWLVVCLVGIIPGVANTEHVAGLVIGALWGFLRSGELKTRRRRRQYLRK